MEDIAFSEFEKAVEDLVLKTPAPGKHSARSAIRYIRRAWRLQEIDKEFAAFAIITSEEEAATAIIHSLQRRKYPGAERLSRWKHPHKWAIIALLEALDKSFRERKTPNEKWKAEVEIDTNQNPKRMRVRITMPEHKVVGYPVPPLNFTFEKNGKKYDFESEFAALAAKSKVSSIQKYVDRLANRRNQILYAGSQGLPNVAGDLTEAILERKHRIFSLLGVYLMIDPYSEHQTFVKDVLNVLLPIVQQVKMPNPEA